MSKCNVKEGAGKMPGRFALLPAVFAVLASFAAPAFATDTGGVVTPEVTTPSSATHPVPQIVGGSPVSNTVWRRNFRWVVGLIQAGSDPFNGQFCGGSLIAPQWVLTAAHCLPGLQPEDVQILIGTPVLSRGGALIDVDAIYAHPDYEPGPELNDIGLIHLATPVNMPLVTRANGAAMQAIGRPGMRVTALGWGDQAEDAANYPNRLRRVTLPLTSLRRCRSDYSADAITGGMICAGRPRGGIDACQGDSGGPLAARLNGAWVQVGITSWGVGCARPNQAGVYTRVSYYRRWINRTMRAHGN